MSIITYSIKILRLAAVLELFLFFLLYWHIGLIIKIIIIKTVMLQSLRNSILVYALKQIFLEVVNTTKITLCFTCIQFKFLKISCLIQYFTC